MRILALTFLLVPVFAAAQPSAADSALVGRAVRALGLDGPSARTALQFGGLPPSTGPRPESLTDSVRAAFYADFRPGAIREALAFLEGPVPERLEAASPFGPEDGPFAAVRAADDPGDLPLADSALATAYTRALLEATDPIEVMRRTIERVETLREGGSGGDDLGRMGRGFLEVLDSEEGRDGLVADAARITRVQLGSADPADVRAATDFYASEAGRYVFGRVLEGSVAATVAGMRETFGRRLEQPLPEGTEARVGVVGEESGIPALFNAVQRAVVYPEPARAEGVEGAVMVEVVIGEGGVLERARVVESPDPRLSEAALEAVRSADLPPVEVGGGVPVTLPVLFRLGERGGVAQIHTRRTPAGSPVYTNVARVREAVVYPESARAEGVGGEVVVRMVLDAEGRLVEASVVRSPNPRLSAAALEAVRSVELVPPSQTTPEGRAPVTFPVVFDPAE